MKLHAVFIVVFILGQASQLSYAFRATVAFLKGDDVFIMEEQGQGVRRVHGTSGPKWALRWLPDGEHLSYLTPDTDDAKARLVVFDLAGHVTRESRIRPKTDPPTEGLRSIEDLTWISPRFVRVQGSINPRNCESFDIDVENGSESNWQMGECGTFTTSPDGTHIAYRGLVAKHRTSNAEIPLKLTARQRSAAGRGVCV